jgi:cysteine synthase
VPDAASIATMRWLSHRMGRAVGASTGTNVWAALALIAEMVRSEETGSVVTLLCDSGDRYLSTYYDDAWLVDNGIELGPYAAALDAYGRTGAFTPPPG